MKYLLVLSLVLLSIPGFAQTLDRAIIATDITSVDALVAKAAGDKTGIPVLIAEDGLLNDDVKSQLASLNIKTVILVGGPAVIKPAAADELQTLGFTVVRLWGIERTGTAIEVAKYFWPSSDCAVLADDTKNSDADTELQSPASSLASESNCPLIPIPAGTLPAEVLALLNNLNASEIKIITKTSPDTSQLTKFKLKVIVGDRKKIESEVEAEVETEAAKEGKKLKLVIVAAPHWRHGLSTGAHPSERSVVRFVTNVSEIPELITKIKEKNITDVRVVGIPSLAQEVASLLNQSGITVKVVSGEKATKVAKELLEELKEKWSDKKKTYEKKRDIAKFKEKLLERLNETEEELNEQEVELEELKAEGADPAKVAEIQAGIEKAKSKLTSIRALILELSVDAANSQLADILSEVREKKWLSRVEIKLKVLEKLKEEEEERGEKEREAQEKIAELEGKFSKLRERCNSTAVEDLVAKAKSLRDEARKSVEAGDHGKSSQFLIEVKRLVETAKGLGNVCEKEAKISEKLQKIAEKRAPKAKMPELEIESPKAGETVTGTEVTVKAKVENFNLKAAVVGVANRAGEGHLHYYLDEQELRSPRTEVTYSNITAGSHTVRVELHNNDHSLLAPAVIKSVNITTTSAASSSGTSSGTSGSGSGY